MDDAERAELSRRLRKLLKLMYLTSLGAAHIYEGHARRAGVRRDELRRFASKQRERREESRALLGLLGVPLPWQRPLWHGFGWLWGRLTSLASPIFSLRMLANIEHEAQKITRAADLVARELVLLPQVQGLARMAKAEAERKEWLLSELGRDSRVASPASSEPAPDTRPETRDS